MKSWKKSHLCNYLFAFCDFYIFFVAFKFLLWYDTFSQANILNPLHRLSIVE